MNIDLFIPQKTIEIDYFYKLLSKINQLDKRSSSHISFVTQPFIDPQIVFNGFDSKKICFNIGGLPVCFNTMYSKTTHRTTREPEVLNKKDNFGEYLEVKWPDITYSQLNFKQLFDRIKNNIVSLDHVGFDINSKLLPEAKYKTMKKIISKSSLLWDYPGKEWPFLIFEKDPKFEIVYDFKSPYPEIQLDIQTNLSPQEVISMFPKPYGFYDPTPFYGDYCVSVFIYTGWQSTSLRVDLRFQIPNFSHTEWLLTHCTKVKNN